MAIHTKLIDIMKARQAEHSNPLCLDVELDDHETLIRRYFLNYRGGVPRNKGGLRLTDSGLVILCCFFKSYKISLQSDYKPTNRHVVFLDRTCSMPWHLKDNHLILFEESLAIRVKLCQDLDIIMESF